VGLASGRHHGGLAGHGIGLPGARRLRGETRSQPSVRDGYFQEVEAGFSTECRCSVLFPLRIPGAVPRPGLEITFDPRKIAPGAEMTFGAEDGESGVGVDYTPLGGHQMSRGIMLGFSSGRAGGHGRVRFDVLEPQPGGHVKGTLLHATLSGYYESAESARTTEPEPARKLELWNFPFDVTLERSPLGDG
jgi:hypothetical protein